jgi:hypothetical protein
MSSPADQRRAEALHKVSEATEHRQAVTAAAEQRFRAAVRHALTVGVPASMIASAAGITRGRIYQIRDGRR